MTKLALIGLLLVLALAAAQIIAARGFARTTATLEDRLRATPPPAARSDLPEIVRAFALRGGAEPGALAPLITLRQETEMRLQRGGNWQPMAARQTIATGAPGFVWAAVQRKGPLPMVRVVDAFVDGRGKLAARLLGSVPVASSTGIDTDIGEAMRYLAELVWAPDAILGNPELIWEQVADDAVVVSLAPPLEAARVRMRFDAAGDVVEITARNRPATAPDGSLIYLDWRATLGGYATIGNRRVPRNGEVGYLYPEGYEPYWRGTITAYRAGD